MRRFLTAGIGAALIAFAMPGPSHSQSANGTSYSALELLASCQLADSDSRNLGVVAEIECEQYVMGVVNTLQAVEMAGTGTEICPPDLNTADEIRWAFTRWVHADYASRKTMSAAEALIAVLRESFACSN